MASGFYHSSSSMATGQPCFTYDVFLSFRGDTRKNFTDHLYKALEREGIRTFRDDDAMDRGKQLKPELEKAIIESAISLIVFSKSYASSTWCLDEVLMSIKAYEISSSKHEVIPVFYKVKPSDVRYQTGCFKEAFDAYDDEIKAETNLEKKRELLEKVGAWRGSLKKAAHLTGMELTDGYEAEFVTDIVNVIRKKLDYKSLYIEDKLVGMKDDVNKIESWLQDSSPNAVILLIDGMGGIGKTTIAKCIFNSNSRNYDGSCFLADINETSNQPGGLLRLQGQLLSTILKSEKEESVWNVHEGTVKVEKAIRNKKVLIILDDVATRQQLEALLGQQRFYPRSKVIITTTHKELYTAFKVHYTVHSVRTLSISDATKLFSLHAFDQDQPIEPYIIQTEVFVHYCKGLPLALKVLGSSLCGNTNDVWEDTMRKLKAILDPKIQKVLQISYETLADDKNKDLFLHIACFFEGEKEDYIVKLLAQCDLYPVAGIKNLKDRCLLYIGNGRVRMHQLIKKMGREVVRQESPQDPGKRSRLWRHEDCFNVLQDHAGTKKVVGLMFDMEKFKEAKSTYNFKEYPGNIKHGKVASFKIAALEKMKNLILLKLNYVTFSGKYKNLPQKLRLLSWHGFPLKSIPSDICLEMLVVLDLSYSKLKRVWDGLKFIGSLKILNLSRSVELIETPDFDGLPFLESLILRGCSSLTKVHESIACLQELVLLDLTGCRSLREFPCLPTSLVSLEISGCLNSGVLERVKCLDSVPSFSNLKHLDVSYCNLVDSSFSNEWRSLVSLDILVIDGNNVTSLPKCIQTLPGIKALEVSNCSQLQSIIGLPKSLKFLTIVGNESLRKVQPAPESRITVHRKNCPNLYYNDGHIMVQSADKVERKILRYLGLKSNAGEGMELGFKVFHQFGIFATFVPKKQIPSRFIYRIRGPQISFVVPSLHNGSRIQGFSMCAILSQPTTNLHVIVKMEVYNETKDLVWTYQYGFHNFTQNVEKRAWLSLWRCGNLLEFGDKFHARIDIDSGIIVVGCCINLIYEDDEQLDGERKEAHHVNTRDQMSWTDRTPKDISNYVRKGGRHSFTSLNWIP